MSESKGTYLINFLRRTRFRLMVLTLCGGLALAPKESEGQAADVWSGNCSPDIIQIFPNTLIARCAQTGVWYEMPYANRTEAYIDRIVKTLQAAQLSGKNVQFRDVGVSPIGARAFDAVALNR